MIDCGALGRRAIAACLAALIVAGCGPGSGTAGRQPAITAATIGDQTLLDVAEYLSSAPYIDADPDRGRSLYLQCRACHAIEPGGPNLAGPSLHGIFGRPAGAVADFPYSRVLEQADFVWTPRTMDSWITNPYLFLPGNRMSYAGMRRPEDRRDLIAWMLREAGR
ncbi:MAG: cytochrome c family protein [Gammaproteobacteria bacterium]